jgi:hypothetical protein
MAISYVFSDGPCEKFTELNMVCKYWETNNFQQKRSRLKT